jgi:hypothetical protein
MGQGKLLLGLVLAGATAILTWSLAGRATGSEPRARSSGEHGSRPETVLIAPTEEPSPAASIAAELREVVRPDLERSLVEVGAEQELAEGLELWPLESVDSGTTGPDWPLGKSLIHHWPRSRPAGDHPALEPLTLSGTVRFSDGSPAADALVLGERDEIPCFLARSGADGVFESEVDPGAALELEAQLQRGEESWVGRLAMVAPGARGLALELTPAASLCANVLGARNELLAFSIRRPEADAALDVVARPALCSSSARIDAGQRFDGLVPGTYLVEVAHRVRPLGAWRLVEVESGRTGEVTLELQPTTLLQVELEGGADSVRVCADGGLERTLTSHSGANDSWSDFLPPGTYRVEARRGNTRATTEVVLTGERNLALALAFE